jgi:nicotinate-nucleotide adenylyltransferase
MNGKERVGILGGSFNPLHIGHLIMARDAMELFDLTRTMLIPCSTPPHQKTSVPISAEHRFAMIESALEDDLSLEVSDIEMSRGGVSYAVDTISALKKANPDADYYFIIGADTLLELHSWKNIYDLLQLCTFVTIARPGVNIEAIKPEDLKLDDPWPDRLLGNIAAGHGIGISSSDIRCRIAEGMNIRDLIPRSVEMYIAEHNLYTI